MTLAMSGKSFVPEPQRLADPQKVKGAVDRIVRQIDKFQHQEEDYGNDCQEQFNTRAQTLCYPNELGDRARAWWEERKNGEKVPARLPALISRVLMVLLITNDSDTVTSALQDQAFAFGDYQIAMHQLMPEDAVTNVQEFERIIINALTSNSNGLSFRQVKRVVHPERRKLLGGYGPFMQAWKNLLSASRLGSDKRGKIELFWLKD
jgi:hypothetical protein